MRRDPRTLTARRAWHAELRGVNPSRNGVPRTGRCGKARRELLEVGCSWQDGGMIAIIGYLGYRFLTRGERGSRLDALTTIAGSEG